MTFIYFLILLFFTVSINVFISIFLIYRSTHSKKSIESFRRNAQQIINAVTIATEKHVSVAEETIGELKIVIENAKKILEATKSKSIRDFSLQIERKKRKYKKVSKERQGSLLYDKGMIKRIKNAIKSNKTDQEIAKELNISLAEVSLARIKMR